MFLIISLITILLLFFIISFGLFIFIFYVFPKRTEDKTAIDLPPGKIYEPFYDKMRKWVIEARNTPCEVVSITSFDGLKLTGKYYEYAPDAPIELMFHGYRGNAERDLAGGMHRAFKLGHSALIVDQRCSGNSEGHVITFGIREYKDCLAWLDFMVSHFGENVKIILTGISMGASTVLIAAGQQIPSNVVGVLADCGFHSAKDVICSVADSMHLPSGLLYPIVKFSARLYGHFDLEEISAVESVANCRVPVLFFHGDADDYVPSYMSQINYEACNSRKKIVFIPNAGHGLSFPIAPDRYIKEMDEFFH